MAASLFEIQYFQAAESYLTPIAATFISHLAPDWNGRSLFMFAYDLQSERFNETLPLALVRVPVGAELGEKADGMEMWNWEIDAVTMRPAADGRIIAVDQGNR